MPPNTAATPSLKISSRAAMMPLGGLDSSSRCTSSIWRPPSSPPLALISSIAMESPRVMASPDWAEAPDSAAISPILIGSAANTDAIVPARIRAALIAVDAAAGAPRKSSDGLLINFLLFARLIDFDCARAEYSARNSSLSNYYPWMKGVLPPLAPSMNPNCCATKLAAPRIDNDGKILHWRLNELLRPVSGRG